MTTPATLALLAVFAADPPPAVKGDAAAVVRQSIDHHGGIAAWAAKKTVQFKKTTTRFAKDGSVERRRVQLHRYVLRPRFKARVEWEEDGKAIVNVNDGAVAWKLVDGRPATATEDVNQARNGTFGSHYVFNMPFKLLDPGASLALTGRRRLPGGVLADAVRVTYGPGVGDAGGMHTWTYFIDAKSGRLTANHLTYGPSQYDYTEYHDDVVADGITIARRRLGYAADARGRVGPRMSEIVYDDVRFDVPLDDGLFAPRVP